MPQTLASQAVKNVVLVHGAFANGSSWDKVIPKLQAKDLHVVAVHLPFTGFADDVTAAKRVIDAQDGPVLLVGHSYGGAIITEAGNDPKVVGLVYVAAFAPKNDEAVGDTGKDFPKPAGLDELRPFGGDGYLLLTPAGYAQHFAPDLTAEEKQILIATQPPAPASIFGAKIPSAAWHSKPSWYVVASNDHMIAPEYEKSIANHINADTTVVHSSHVAMLSCPNEVAAVIEHAAAGKTQSAASSGR